MGLLKSLTPGCKLKPCATTWAVFASSLGAFPSIRWGCCHLPFIHENLMKCLAQCLAHQKATIQVRPRPSFPGQESWLAGGVGWHKNLFNSLHPFPSLRPSIHTCSEQSTSTTSQSWCVTAVSPLGRLSCWPPRCGMKAPLPPLPLLTSAPGRRFSVA